MSLFQFILAKTQSRRFFQFFVTALLLTSYTSDNSLANDIIAPEAASDPHYQQKLAQGKAYAIATANRYASQAAKDILQQGGTAIDAAIAAQMVLGLVEPQSSGIGGGGFLVHWDSNSQQLSNYDGREIAPSAVNENYFRDKHGTLKFYDAVIGGYSVGVPGLLAMLELAHKQHGELDWAKLFQPAIALAEQGFEISPRLHQLTTVLNQGPFALAEDSSSRALADYLLDRDGKAKAAGSVLKNQAYADTLKQIAAKGSGPFYHGELAKNIVKQIRQHSRRPGLMTLNDMKNYTAKSTPAVCSQVNELSLCGAAPPSSGPITVMQIIHMLAKTPGFYQLEPTGADFYHRFIEASKLAFADRNRYIADPAFYPTPVSALLEPSYLSKRAALIPTDRASDEPAEAGELGEDAVDAISPELDSTTHLSIVDAKGNIVSMTSSIETAFGSRVFVDGYLLNNQLTDFSFSPSMHSKKVANRIEAGKRPRSSMSPMIIFKDQQPLLVIGSPGGARIIAYVSKVIAQHLLLQLPLEQAVASPHISNLNRSISSIEPQQAADKLTTSLMQKGHKIQRTAQTSGLHVINLGQQRLKAVADYRREGEAYAE